jgi:membrane-bound inhibitor of C-type lysozyme
MMAKRAPAMLCSIVCTTGAQRMLIRRSALPLLVAATLVAGCQDKGPTKEELEAAKNTVDCANADERIVIRFEDGEARLLMPDGTRVILYQVPSGSGIRYLNGLMELRGKGMDLELTREQVPMRLKCKPYEIPKKE